MYLSKIKWEAGYQSSGSNPIDGDADIDELVLGGKEKGKVGRSYDSRKRKTVCAVELTQHGKVKRMYALLINDFSTQSLSTIFDNILMDLSIW